MLDGVSDLLPHSLAERLAPGPPPLLSPDAMKQAGGLAEWQDNGCLHLRRPVAADGDVSAAVARRIMSTLCWIVEQIATIVGRRQHNRRLR